jgi:hypothetical protein
MVQKVTSLSLKLGREIFLELYMINFYSYCFRMQLIAVPFGPLFFNVYLQVACLISCSIC